MRSWRLYFFLFSLSTAGLLVQSAGAQPSHAEANAVPAPGRGTGTPAVTAGTSANERPPAMKPVPKLADAEKDLFLKTAKIVSTKVLNAGTTGSMRVTLSDGKLTHDAHVQCIDVFKPVWRGAEGTIEKNFRDSWKFNIAAYRLSKLLGLDMVPMSVEREVNGKLCSVTWWVDNVWLVEYERRDKGIKPPATDEWVNQLNIVRVFDQLIYNMDRNQGNLLITPDWKLWMIDHTRAFRDNPKLQKPDNLRRIDKNLLGKLRQLNAGSLTREAGPWLRAEDISALLARRDAIVRYFEEQIREKGEDSVLSGMPRTTPQVSVP